MKQPDEKRPDPSSAGQSGDDMGLPDDDVSAGESVAELVREGQFFEAEAVAGTDRPYPDEREVRTREVPEDDVPLEYLPEDDVVE